MKSKEKKVLLCLICMAITLMGMIAFIDAMIEKFGMVAIPVYLFVWLILVCVYIVCIQKLNNK